MCCTIGASVATLSATRLYAGEAMFNDKYVHVLAYQNKAKSNGPNAMIIPFPTNVAMDESNVLDTSKYKNFLNDISEATKARTRSLSRGDDLLSFGAVAKSAKVFDVGDYTVILATNVAQVPEALKRVSVDKRPTVSNEFLIGYGVMYPNQPVALCCWKGSVEPAPLLWWYEPKDKDTLFVPTMDAHDGKAPDVEAEVSVDHIISVGSNLFANGSMVYYEDFLYEGAPLLPKKVQGIKFKGRMKNGDMFVSVADVRSKERGALIKRANFHTEMNGWR